MKSAIIIGSGFSGLSAATYLAEQNFRVLVLEKNENQEEEQGYSERMDLHLIWDQAAYKYEQ